MPHSVRPLQIKHQTRKKLWWRIKKVKKLVILYVLLNRTGNSACITGDEVTTSVSNEANWKTSSQDGELNSKRGTNWNAFVSGGQRLFWIHFLVRVPGGCRPNYIWANIYHDRLKDSHCNQTTFTSAVSIYSLFVKARHTIREEMNSFLNIEPSDRYSFTSNQDLNCLLYKWDYNLDFIVTFTTVQIILELILPLDIKVERGIQ